MQFEQDVSAWITISDEDKAAIQAQLERLLQNPHFHNSKRYPSFLKFVVSEALEGQIDHLKERTIGIEVFGRTPSYDTTNDPIVRVTAAEIRKRIAQYYQDPGHENEVRLLLPSGSYVPQFKIPKPEAPAPAELPHEDQLAAAHSVEVAEATKPHKNALISRKAVYAIVLLALAIGSAVLWQMFHDPPLEAFWRPFIKSDAPVLFCIADQSQYSTITLRDAADPLRQTTLNDQMLTVIIDDVSPLVNLAGMLQVHGKEYHIKGEAMTTLTDLRQGPTVFIGAFDNGWTLRLTAPLRYHFGNNADMTQFWVEDREAPGKREWLLDRNVQRARGTYKDYAIVARFTDPNTDRPVVIAAGIGRGGTVAAGEFLVDRRNMSNLMHDAPKNWAGKNIEVVLETQVIDDRSGPPRVAAVHVW